MKTTKVYVLVDGITVKEDSLNNCLWPADVLIISFSELSEDQIKETVPVTVKNIREERMISCRPGFAFNKIPDYLIYIINED